MSRESTIDIAPWRAYLAAFDEHLRAHTMSDVEETRERMTRELRQRGVATNEKPARLRRAA